MRDILGNSIRFKEHAMNRNLGQYLAFAGLGAAVLGGMLEIAAGPGTRLGIWQFRTGLALLRVAGIAGAAAAAVSLLAGILAGVHGPSFRTAAAGLLIGLIAAGIPVYWLRTAETVPRIHDITTDTRNPPVFRAILPLRRNARNPVTYGGPAVAEQQRRAYPDIRPLVLTGTPDAVFDRALSVAREMGWEIVWTDPRKEGFEATATTFWFGFKDDVVVRIEPVTKGIRVDVRSVSRVGLSDMGTNAKRIRMFLAKLKAGT
jgi:uncharacterized protein (DUF1499 family)